MKVKRITSRSNSTVKDIRKLLNRKGRSQQQRYLLEGIRIVGTALEQKAPVTTLLFSPALLTSDFGKELVSDYGNRVGEVLEVSADVFSSFAQKEHPQGIAAVVQAKYAVIDDLEMQQDDVWVALDTIRDPGNLGTILRTLDAVGGCGVILLDDCVDEFDPTAVRASMGAIFTQGMIHATSEEFADWKTKQSMKIVGTSDHQGTYHYRELQYTTPLVLLMGSERAGLPSELIDLCDEMVFIPMFGSCDSLNLAVATGIVLSEISYQLKGVV